MRTHPVLSIGQLRRALLLAVCLNSFDGIFTAIMVGLGLFQEVNPMMDSLLRTSPEMFLTFKLGLVNAVILWVWCQGQYLIGRISVLVVIAAYSAVAIWHLVLTGLLAYSALS